MQVQQLFLLLNTAFNNIWYIIIRWKHEAATAVSHQQDVYVRRWDAAHSGTDAWLSDDQRAQAGAEQLPRQDVGQVEWGRDHELAGVRQ